MSLYVEKVDFLKFSTDFSSFPDDDMPIQSKGGYNLDFDNLDAINPFQGSSNIILSPPRPAGENPSTHDTESHDKKSANVSEESSKIDSALDETLPFTPSVENSLADISANISSTESSVVTVLKAPAPDSDAGTPDKEQCDIASTNADEDQASGTFVEEAPLPAKASYTFDFDDLDAINPFQTGGSKIPNSPVLERQIDHPTSEEITENKAPDVAAVASVPPEAPVQPDIKPVAPIPADVAMSTETDSQLSDVPVNGGPVKLEFNFDDGGEVRQKPPPKKFGKRPQSFKSKAGKPPSDVKPAKETPVNPDNAEVDIPAPKGSYTFDFDKFDDPNFNPFGTNSNINDSPKCSKNSPPVVADETVEEKPEKPLEKEAVSPMWCVHVFMNPLLLKFLQQFLTVFDGLLYFLFFYSAEESTPAAEIHPGAETKVTRFSHSHFPFTLIIWVVFLNSCSWTTER